MKISLKEQLQKFAYTLKKKREALGYTVRDLEKYSGVSKALISKIETCKINDFPKPITIKLLNDGLKCKNDELLILANILSEKQDMPDLNWQGKLKEFLATETILNASHIEQVLAYVERLSVFQELTEGEVSTKYPELKKTIESILKKS